MSHGLPVESAASPRERESPATGECLRIALACPNCAEPGWVDWKNLRRAMHCHACDCRFFIDRQGQLAALQAPRERYTCPRCQHAGWIPQASIVTGTQCPHCLLELVRGPDQQLIALVDLPQARREARAAFNSAKAAERIAPVRSRPRLLILSLPVTLLVFILGGLIYRVWPTNDPAALASRFTQECLAGDFVAAAEYVMPGEVQQIEFERWRLRMFASLIARFRPPGDRVEITVSPRATDAQGAVFEIVARSKFIGERVHQQRWQQIEGRWLFDARETVAAVNPGQVVTAAEPASAASNDD